MNRHKCRVCQNYYQGKLIEVKDLPERYSNMKKKKIGGGWMDVQVPYKNGRVCPSCLKRTRGRSK